MRLLLVITIILLSIARPSDIVVYAPGVNKPSVNGGSIASMFSKRATVSVVPNQVEIVRFVNANPGCLVVAPAGLKFLNGYKKFEITQWRPVLLTTFLPFTDVTGKKVFLVNAYGNDMFITNFRSYFGIDMPEFVSVRGFSVPSRSYAQSVVELGTLVRLDMAQAVVVNEHELVEFYRKASRSMYESRSPSMVSGLVLYVPRNRLQYGYSVLSYIHSLPWGQMGFGTISMREL